jgi:hypothetical protein
LVGSIKFLIDIGNTFCHLLHVTDDSLRDYRKFMDDFILKVLSIPFL